MKFKIALAALLVATSAFAQEAPPSPAPSTPASPAPSQAPQKFYLELEQADLTALSQAINELPKRIADPLLLKLNAQLQSQQDKIAASAQEMLGGRGNGPGAAPEKTRKGRK